MAFGPPSTLWPRILRNFASSSAEIAPSWLRSICAKRRFALDASSAEMSLNAGRFKWRRRRR